MLFGPMYALINLFICILRDLNHSRVDNALSLMEVGAGYFARLKIASNSKISIQFAKELALLAHAIVHRNAKGLVGADHAASDPFSERLSSSDQSPVVQDNALVNTVSGNHIQPTALIQVSFEVVFNGLLLFWGVGMIEAAVSTDLSRTVRAIFSTLN